MNENEQYSVVKNEEDQYSIWPKHKEVPMGWESVEKVGTKQECLNYIKEIWVDMRPLSLQNQMEKQ